MTVAARQRAWTLLFDFGNTLAPFNEREAAAVTADLAEFAERRAGLHAPAFARTWLEEREADFARSAVTGVEHDFGARFARVCARLGEEAPAALREAAEAAAVESFVRHVRVDPEVIAAVARLAERARLGVLSNYLLSEPIHRVLARDGAYELFEKVLVSSEIGYAKPDPRCFEAILSALPPRRDRTVYIGDDFTADIAGAARAGLRAVWTLAMRVPTPEIPAALPPGVLCLRSRAEYLEFLAAPENLLRRMPAAPRADGG
jgi:5'-nucleotidase